MSEKIKVFYMDYKKWWILFFFIQLFLITLMIGMMGTTKWVYSKNNFTAVSQVHSNRTIFGNDFKASVSTCLSGCKGEDNLGVLSRDWCDEYNDANKTAQYYDSLKSACEMFGGLAIGSGLFVILEIISIVAILSWGLGMILYAKKFNCICLTYCCTCCLWTSHYFGFIIFILAAGARFDSSLCEENVTLGDKPVLCASDGPALGLFILLIIPIVVTLFCAVACNLNKHHGHKFKRDYQQEMNEQPPPVAVIVMPPGINQDGNMNPQYYVAAPVQTPQIYAGIPQYIPGMQPTHQIIMPPQHVPGMPPQYAPGVPPQYVPGIPPQYISGMSPQYDLEKIDQDYPKILNEDEKRNQ